MYSLKASPDSFPGIDVQNCAGALAVSRTGVMPSLEMAVVVAFSSTENTFRWQRTVLICCTAAVSRYSLISSAYLRFSAFRALIDCICRRLLSRLP